jgi:hypothetical protein
MSGHHTNHRQDEKPHACAPRAGRNPPRVTPASFGLGLPKAFLAILAIAVFLYTSSDIVIFARRVVPPSDFADLPARTASQSRLEVIQLSAPVLIASPDGELQLTDGSKDFPSVDVPASDSSCQDVLVVHSFATSYGQPYVGQYTPPSCSFNRVTWNLTVVSAGKQFDRLGSVSFGDVELFRTSTAEPTLNGIEWHYLKVTMHRNASS